MFTTLNHQLFLAINGPAHPGALILVVAELAASWLVYAAAAVAPALWVWGRQDARPALLATVIGVSAALGINQALGLLWYEPRPFMIGLGHTLTFHRVENSFPSDHATFLGSLGLALIVTGASQLWGALVCLAGLLAAWARIYLGLHFPIDMAASFLVAIAGSGLAVALRPACERWLCPVAQQVYDTGLRWSRLPPTLFPRGPEH